MTNFPRLRALSLAGACALLILSATGLVFAQDISSTPSSLKFANTYVGKASGSKVLTINKVTSGKITISSLWHRSVRSGSEPDDHALLRVLPADRGRIL
jgi:hypothetical protein